MNRGSVANASYHGHRGYQYRPEFAMPYGALEGEGMGMGIEMRHQQQYVSDPTLLDGGKAESVEESGRRSAQGNYPSASETNNSNGRKVKKKKMKKFKSFMHVFLGGLNNRKHHQSISQDAWDGAAGHGGRYHQKKATGADVPTSLSPAVEKDQSLLVTEVPGLCGLYNHGNTCFMNAILQCLSNTDQLAEYFVTDQYKNDLNRQKLSTRATGVQTDITEQFAILLKCLWNCQYDPRVTGRFKDVVAKYASQYQGASQHDAQEFFLWLLDSVHEDLNQASKKKYRPIKVSWRFAVSRLYWLMSTGIHNCSLYLIFMVCFSMCFRMVLVDLMRKWRQKLYRATGRGITLLSKIFSRVNFAQVSPALSVGHDQPPLTPMCVCPFLYHNVNVAQSMSQWCIAARLEIIASMELTS